MVFPAQQRGFACKVMDQQMLKLKGAVRGKGHSDTLASINNLAVAPRPQGKYGRGRGDAQTGFIVGTKYAKCKIFS